MKELQSTYYRYVIAQAGTQLTSKSEMLIFLFLFYPFSLKIVAWPGAKDVTIKEVATWLGC